MFHGLLLRVCSSACLAPLSCCLLGSSRQSVPASLVRPGCIRSTQYCSLQVQVQRRETERQAEQRLASFAHISQTEAEEKWKTLNYASPDSEVASGIWDRLMKPMQQEVSLASMPCAAYLATLTAGKAGLPISIRSQREESLYVGTMFAAKPLASNHFRRCWCKVEHKIELSACSTLSTKFCSGCKQLQLGHS